MLKPRLGGPPSKARSYSISFFFLSLFFFSFGFSGDEVWGFFVGSGGLDAGVSFGLGSFGVEVGWGSDVKL